MDAPQAADSSPLSVDELRIVLDHLDEKLARIRETIAVVNHFIDGLMA